MMPESGTTARFKKSAKEWLCNLADCLTSEENQLKTSRFGEI